MAMTTAQLTTAMAAQATRAVAGGLDSGLVVDVQLRFVNGKSFIPADLLNALKTQYGAAKVLSPRDALSVEGSTYHFDVIP
jgi:hypothetical protein